MYTVIISLIVVVSILLALIVLVQDPKGGGLASNFSSSNQVMGVRKTTDFLEKATWSLAGVLALLCIFSVAFTQGPSNAETEPSSVVDKNAIENVMSTNTEKKAVPTAQLPAAAAPQQAQQPQQAQPTPAQPVQK